MIGFLITIHAIISVLLITVVLMQASQGGGLSGLSGTQTTNAIFGGRSAGNALSKITTYLAAIFMGLALLISLIASPGSRSCLLYTSPSPRDLSTSRMPSSA